MAEKAIRGIKISSKSRISKYPVYVGWVPTRNIYASVAALAVRLSAVDGRLSALDGRLERIERLMEALLAK